MKFLALCTFILISFAATAEEGSFKYEIKRKTDGETYESVKKASIASFDDSSYSMMEEGKHSWSLHDSFVVGLSEGDTARNGFGMWLKNKDYDYNFSWEWFDNTKDRENVEFAKRQFDGRIKLIFDEDDRVKKIVFLENTIFRLDIENESTFSIIADIFFSEKRFDDDLLLLISAESVLNIPTAKIREAKKTE